MPEINRGDIIAEEEIEAPLKYAKNSEQMLRSLQAIIDVSKQQSKALEDANSTVELRKMIEALKVEQTELKKVNVELQKNSSEIKNTSKSYEGLAEATDQIAPGLNNAVSSLKALTRAALVFIATPLGAVIAALGAALFALKSYFTSSVEAQHKLNRIMTVGKEVFEAFMNVVEDVGEAIFNAIENPKQAIIDFGKFLYDNITTRLMGVLQLLPALAQALDLAFQGKFKEGAKVAVDAVAKIGLGIENATDKAVEFGKRFSEAMQQAERDAKRVSFLQETIEATENALIVKRAKTELEIAKLKNQSKQLEGKARLDVIKQIMALELDLSKSEVIAATQRLALAKEEFRTSEDKVEATRNIQNATADLYDAQKQYYQNTIRLARELASVEKEIEAERDKVRASKLKAVEKTVKFAEKEIEKQVKKQSEVIISEEEYKNRALTQFAKDMQKREEQQTLTVEQQEEQRARIRRQHMKETAAEVNVMVAEMADVYGFFANSIGASLNALLDVRLEKFDIEEQALEETLERQLKLAGDNLARRSELENDFAKKQSELERKRAAEKRKGAIFDKATAIIDSIINTALAVTAFLSKGNVGLSIAAGIAGAVQTGIIASQPIPAYKEGTLFHRGGKAKVGEEGTELKISPNGNLSLTPSRPTIMSLETGTAILPHDETMKFLAQNGMRIPETLDRKGAENLGKYFRELNHTIKTKKEVHYNLTEAGLRRVFKRGQAQEYFKDNFYK